MSKNKYYLYLAFVILIWGVIPMVTVYFYDYFSASVFNAAAALISASAFTALSWKSRHLMNRRYLLIAGITGSCYSLATIVQRIGLQYTTPSMFAFLENTSCIVVPILLVLLVKKKSHPLVWMASVLCLIGCFVLSGANFGSGFGIGEILCALAGLLFSGNIVGTGSYGKGMHVTLYLTVQMWVHVVLSTLTMLILHFVQKDGTPIEAMRMEWRPGLILALILVILISNTFCWILRTKIIQNANMTVVSIAMPLSAVVTMIMSVIAGTDTLSVQLVAGACIIVAALILSAFGEIAETKKAAQPEEVMQK